MTILSVVERLFSIGSDCVQNMYTKVFWACTLFRGLSSFGMSFIGGFTVQYMLTLIRTPSQAPCKATVTQK